MRRSVYSTYNINHSGSVPVRAFVQNVIDSTVAHKIAQSQNGIAFIFEFCDRAIFLFRMLYICVRILSLAYQFQNSLNILWHYDFRACNDPRKLRKDANIRSQI